MPGDLVEVRSLAEMKQPAAALSAATSPAVTERDLVSLAQRDGKFFCQPSEIVNASNPLPWWEPRQYLWDIKCNRVGLFLFSRAFLIAIYNKFAYHLKLRSWRAVT